MMCTAALKMTDFYSLFQFFQGFKLGGGGMPKTCRKWQIFWTTSWNFRIFWEILGEKMKNCFKCWKIGWKSFRGLEHYVAPYVGGSPHQFQILWGDSRFCGKGDLSDFSFMETLRPLTSFLKCKIFRMNYRNVDKKGWYFQYIWGWKAIMKP